MTKREEEQMVQVDMFIKNNIDIMESVRMKVIRLSNQLLVGNFSSPHAFTFDDCNVLPAVSDYDSMRLKVNFNETIVDDKIVKHHQNSQYISTVTLDFTLSEEVKWEMEMWHTMHKHNDVDIVLCPLPMIQALRAEGYTEEWLINSPFRAVRMKDRIRKTVSCDTFTI
jgi:hypothetical protein